MRGAPGPGGGRDAPAPDARRRAGLGLEHLQRLRGRRKSSLITRISPSIWLENQGELGSARLGLTAVARNVWQESDLSGIDGLARGEFNRKLTPRFNLFGDGLLEHYSGYEEIVEGGSTSTPGGLPGEVILGEQPSWMRDQIGLGFSYMLTERLSFR